MKGFAHHRTFFAIALHLHQPVGNLESILERAYCNCYRPLIDTISRYPDIKITLHISGNLMDFFESAHPDFLDKVASLLKDGQVEIMGGGYYEPVFQAVPPRDRRGQIEMLSSCIEKRFGVRPRGLWLPERIWTPELAGDFAASGIKYTIVDDIHLIRAGVDKKGLSGYFVTGQGDSQIAVFPIIKIFRYSVPFKSPYQNIRYVRRCARGVQDGVVTYGDDAEKFGEWPWTYEWVYKKGWLDKFFQELAKRSHWLRTIRFSDYMERYPPLARVDIPECSYEEMMQWAGGMWTNFLSRYPESNQMHKRMLFVSDRIERLSKSGGKEALREARVELYKGQTNCPYWHGVFGGVYLQYLRRAIYQHLISADRIVDSVEGVSPGMRVKRWDFYRDGGEALLIESKRFFVCVDPLRGGVIRETDYKPGGLNLVNTLARRKEPYHRKIMDRIYGRHNGDIAIQDMIKRIDERLWQGIFYDRYPRCWLVDHFVDTGIKREEFERCEYVDIGGFADGEYLWTINGEKIVLSRYGMVDGRSVYLEKEISISGEDAIGVRYRIGNKSAFYLDRVFGTEFNMLLGSEDPDAYSYRIDDNGLEVRDRTGVRVGFEFRQRPLRIWHFPVMAVSQTERSYELSYQGTCVFPMWHIALASGDSIQLDIKLSVNT